MDHVQFTVADPEVSNRRLQDRRHTPPGNTGRSGWRKHALGLFAIAILSLAAWKWRTVLHGPVWIARAYAADHSDIYKGRTNGISNKDLVLQSRNYLTEINILDASGNITPDDLKSEGAHLDLEWFKHHHPISVDFNPFLPGGSFVVTWRYVPGCQASSSGRDTTWRDMQGKACTVICNLSVLMTPDMRLTSIKVDPARPS